MIVVSFSLRSRRSLPDGVPGVDGSHIRWTGCAVMGVVNVTPDSFSDGGLHVDVDDAVAHAKLLATQGALFVDVGGESTRPGAEPVSLEHELARVVPVVTRLAREASVLISVDTRKPEVAAAAIEAGAHVVNDVGGLRDPAMVAACADGGVPAVVMHMLGEPHTMQVAPHYDDVVADVVAALGDAASAALGGGVVDVMVDPGLGFGKTLEHNLALLRALPYALPHPVLIGASRKQMIEALGGPSRPAQRDPGSLAVHLFAAQRGAAMVRVHAVAAHVEALAVDGSLRG